MIVAGSVLTLLLMGLAVDGFVNSADTEPDDPSNDEGAEADLSDQSGDGDGLLDLLDAAEDQIEQAASSDSQTPLTEVEPEPLSLAEAWAAAEAEEDETTEDETSADSTWTQTASTDPTADFVEIDAVAEMEDGEDVAYVEAFDLTTDTLVLEFDGSEDDAPEIEVTYDPGEDASIVMANGVPVTMVDGAEGMTPEHVRIVMGGDETGLQPQVSPAAEEIDDLDPEADTIGPATISPPSEIDPLLADPEGPLTIPTFEDSLSEDVDQIDTGTDEALTIPTAEGVGTDPENVTAQAEAARPDPAANVEQTGVEGPQTQFVDPNHLEIVIEPAEDPLPDDTVVDAILDQVTGDLTGMGGINEMLDARTDMDDAFGTGGEDALTGSFNNEMLTGGDGQDALFGDDGNDTLIAGAGNDELHGGTGHDDLQGESGVDFLDGGEGNDTLDGGGDRDLLFGGEGDDVLYGGAANDFLQGGLGADILNGGSGDDTLDGVYGDGTTDKDGGDTLWGGSGNDHIILGQGDIAHGGAGADTFTSGSYIETAEVAGHVADFNPSEDRIEVIFDPYESPDPTLEVLDFADGSGADIILNGEVILSVAGAQGLDPNMIDLQARA